MSSELSINVPVGTCEVSEREILSCYDEDDQRCRNSMELKALEGSKARICKETLESENELLNISRSKGSPLTVRC